MKRVDGIRIRTTSVSTGLNRLRTTVASYEKRYSCSSGQMLDAVRTGKARETADVSRWLVSYQALERLEQLSH